MTRPRRRVTGLRMVKRLTSSGPGFLTLERWLVRNVYARGGLSAPYRVEVVHRRGVDAVALVPFFFSRNRLLVIIKIGFRPGLFLRSRLSAPQRDRRRYTFVPEAVAGSIEPGDRGPAGIDARARAELLEEAGLRPVRRTPIRLGAGFFPSHGQSTEKVHLRAFEVDPARAIPPAGDGTVNEGDSGTTVLEAGRILTMCRTGAIEDPKVEIGVGRLCALLGYPVPPWKPRPHPAERTYKLSTLGRGASKRRA